MSRCRARPDARPCRRLKTRAQAVRGPAGHGRCARARAGDVTHNLCRAGERLPALQDEASQHVALDMAQSLLRGNPKLLMSSPVRSSAPSRAASRPGWPGAAPHAAHLGSAMILRIVLSQVQSEATPVSSSSSLKASLASSCKSALCLCLRLVSVLSSANLQMCSCQDAAQAVLLQELTERPLHHALATGFLPAGRRGARGGEHKTLLAPVAGAARSSQAAQHAARSLLCGRSFCQAQGPALVA